MSDFLLTNRKSGGLLVWDNTAKKYSEHPSFAVQSGIDGSVLWTLQKHIDQTIDGTTVLSHFKQQCVVAGASGVTIVNNADVTIPFSRSVKTTGYCEIRSDSYIPVIPGERLYMEVWAYRPNGAPGDVGSLYMGAMAFDKDKAPLDANAGLNSIGYAVAAATVPTTGVWTKYNGYVTVPTSHTPYNGSDGAGCRYIFPLLLVNYASGTIETHISGAIIRRVNVFRDHGIVALGLNSNTGIGTATPNEKLHVTGGILTTGTANNTNYDGTIIDRTGTVSRIISGNTAGSGSQLQFYTAYTSGAESLALQINELGNVDIYGERLKLGGTAFNAVINTINSLRINIDSNNDNDGETFTIGKDQETIDNNNVLFRVQEDGKVGIGLSGPATTLHVRGILEQAVRFDLNDSTVGKYSGLSLMSNNGATGDSQLRAYNTGATSSDLRLYTRNSGTVTEQMRITAAGSVGIGIDPGSKLHVVSANSGEFAAQITHSGTTGAHGLYVSIGAAATGYPLGIAVGATEVFRIANTGVATVVSSADTPMVVTSSAGSSYIRFINSVDNLCFIGANGDKLSLHTNGSERMTVHDNGNVGIGAPEYTKLTVGGTITATDDTTARAYLFAGSTTISLKGRNQLDSGYVSAIYDSLQHIFQASATEIARITSTGLGVGNVSPAVRLHVKSTAAEVMRLETTAAPGAGANYFSFYDNTARKGYVGYGGAGSDNFYITNEVANAYILIMPTGTGAILCGTSANDGQGAVQVGGSVSTRNAGVDGSYGTVLTGVYSSNLTEKNTISSSVSSTASNSGWSFAVSNGGGLATTTEVMRINRDAVRLLGSTRLGIGVTNPGYNLEINGTGLVSGSFQVNGNLITAGNIIASNSSSNPLRLGIDEAETMRIDTSGNVLIKSTALDPVYTQMSSTSNPDFQIRDITTIMSLVGTNTSTNGAHLCLGKIRGGSAGAVQANDSLGVINFQGADGTKLANRSSEIRGEVDGTVSTSIVPGRLVFSTASTSGVLLDRLSIDSSGRALLATTASRSVSGVTAKLQIEDTADTAALSVVRNTADGFGPYIMMSKSRGSTNGSVTAVNSGDTLGSLVWTGADGTDLNATAATLSCVVDSTPGSNDMPARLVFSVSSDGTENPSERLRISATGHLTPGTTDNTQNFGSGANRWATIYAGTGSINTSDAREKTEVWPLTESELKAASLIAKAIGGYKWLYAIKEKGDAARTHIGTTVQTAIGILDQQGLDPMAYAFICYDQWVEEGVQKDRYSFRYDELAMFLIRAQEQRLERLEQALNI